MGTLCIAIRQVKHGSALVVPVLVHVLPVHPVEALLRLQQFTGVSAVSRAEILL